ncbi:MAG TPA: hypothetical protein EYP54_11570 [Anaerolineales bacterium]|nr:hypothetical protein [Anaerolineales bacterium]
MQPSSASSSPFPGILLMGPPNCGKSVLAHWLTRQLWQRRVAHFLLRTAPDGEGNWFYEGEPEAVIPLRLDHKGRYTPELVREMLRVVRERHLPLLVDMGGKPRGEQRKLMTVCTHGILLYRTEEQRAQWHQWLSEEHSPLRLIAELRSDLDAVERIETTVPLLRGVIGGLRRHPPYRPGLVAQALLERLADLLGYDEATLAAYHAQTAPEGADFLHLDDLARALGQEVPHWWTPEELPAALAHLTPKPYALYGRGPVWLTASIAAHLAPHPVWLFDMHFGWIPLPEVVPEPRPPWLLTLRERGLADEVSVTLEEPFVHWGTLPWRGPRKGSRGVILSGKLPRWAFAAWVRYLQPSRPWIAIYDPRFLGAVVVASRDGRPAVGSLIPLAGR